MPSLDVPVDDRCIERNAENQYTVRISSAEGNGIYYTSSGKLDVKSTGDAEEILLNYPGNGIVGTYNKAVSMIQCDSSVSRIQKTNDDTLKQHEGLYIPDLVQSILDDISP